METILLLAALFSLNTVHAITFKVERPEAVKVPSKSDVIKTQGRPSKVTLPSDNKFKFLVWNLHKGQDASFALEYLSLSFDRDIIINQEIFLDNGMNGVFNFLPHLFFTTATSFFSGKKRIRTGIANISTVKPSITDFIRTEALEPILSSPKMTLITSYPMKGTDKLLTIVNLHGINFVSSKGYRSEMERIFQKIKNIPSPLIFTGDFNTWNEERMDILANYTKKLGLSEALFSPDERLTFNEFPLDHFLHTKDIKILEARADKFYKGSDHKPLLVEVEYSPIEWP